MSKTLFEGSLARLPIVAHAFQAIHDEAPLHVPLIPDWHVSQAAAPLHNCTVLHGTIPRKDLGYPVSSRILPLPALLGLMMLLCRAPGVL